METKPNLFDYTDYRVFLQSYSEHKRHVNKQWSYQTWALRLGLKNNTSILKVLNGQREAGKEIQAKIIKYFNFDADQERFFLYLVQLSKAKGDIHKASKIRKALKKEFNVVPKKTIDEKVFMTFSHWISMVIRQCNRLKSFNFSAMSLKSNLIVELPVHKIESALNNLSQLGMIEIQKNDDQTKWVTKDLGIQTTEDVISKSIQDYHKNIMSLATTAIGTVEVTQREFSSTTIAMKESDIEEAKAYLRNFEEDFCNKFEVKNKNADQIYIFNMQLFPITKFDSGGNYEE